MLSTFSASAQWYEATGQAKVRHGDYKSAKSRALQDAVKQAMLFSGANVSSVQTISQGLLIDDHTQIQALGIVNQIEIVEERQSGSTFSITVRADIFAEDSQCYSSEFSKKVAITQFSIQNWEDAKIGGLYPFEKEIPRRVSNLLKDSANGVYPVPWLSKKLNINADFEQQGKVRHQVIDAIADSANTQFVMLGRITDLSFGSTTNDFMFWQDDSFERFFALELIVANALTHEVLYQNRFQTSGDWSIPKDQVVNTKGQQFWDGDYGIAIENLLTDVKDDLQATLNCQQIQGRIMSVKNGEQIQLNIGRGQGVKVGQEYRVSYRADVTDDRGNLLTNFVISPYRVKITQVFENSAVAESLDSTFMNNVQVNDLIELKDWDNAW